MLLRSYPKVSVILSENEESSSICRAAIRSEEDPSFLPMT